MNTTDTIKALRDALTECRNYLSDFYANAKVRGAEAAHKNAFKMQQVADDALALTADASEDAPRVADRASGKVMMSAHALCPTEGAHPDRMRWMAEYFLKHYPAAARPAPVAATPAPDKSPAQHSMIAAINDVFGQKDRKIAELQAMLAASPAAPIAEVTGEGTLLEQEYSDTLRALACYLGAGGWNSYGLIPPKVADDKIRWGIDEAVKGAKGMSNAAAARWCRENGLNVPPHWEAEHAKPEPVAHAKPGFICQACTEAAHVAMGDDELLSNFVVVHEVAPAKMAEGPSKRDQKQLTDWLLRNPVDGGKLTFAGPPEAFGLGLSQVKMMDAEGSEWTLIAGLREGYKTEAERNTTLLRVVKEEIAADVAKPAVCADVEQAFSDIRAMVDFAYEQGFHELGYDPVAAIRGQQAGAVDGEAG